MGGLLLTAAAFIGLVLLPVNFSYYGFAALLAISGIGTGLFSSPNASMIMTYDRARVVSRAGLLHADALQRLDAALSLHLGLAGD